MGFSLLTVSIGISSALWCVANRTVSVGESSYEGGESALEMARSVWTVGVSETRSVSELVRSLAFIQALDTAFVLVPKDGFHSGIVNQILTEHLSPLSVVFKVYLFVAPRVEQLHTQQHSLYLWVQYFL